MEKKVWGEPGGFSHLLITFSRLKQIAGKLWCPRLVVIKRLRRLKASAAQKRCLLLGFRAPQNQGRCESSEGSLSN